ncbi:MULTISPECIES: D-alanyl-D-alanine carboxypeptidase family protein [unclassified Oceanobacter]|jgi:D-alanyl-D-alanine carboxypeptidase (penicillin-binding protein 5/6)|uniref:D-alanyl-D-alanine carboxypeptidase family protein n=1 Tax=unclassified Oceanobacter TaxID=2620260 RepID=UPI0027350643|nr:MULTISPECIES: D-alanyl-D-alanine carboxypeptidase family protein [unclassified Oceanobacter]MDP2506592.1 D-alanyl-D-alanine carboxypeptidase family protein [Oceanobacter sp. 3_MG-2023]MDP2548961.1 D-alanyl-D-alanine carboxypeptidase family protein [Oceanobacter sp. 4_MG-2023]MDP2609655.1 D-alanyl-D-alanine carboxypeptidase family protein [Oceanobacter sp. 1_MG-2023]MDP2613373.1 D-alanyl-D-alanine carboxypeptidase family protein [Oceanobacter sp. 2_MG-2023]
MRYLLSLFLYLSAACASAAIIVPKAPDLDARAFILIDAESGNVLVEHNADETLPPASLTKMLTSYIAVHELVTGNVTDDTMVPISVNAWKKGGSKMFVREGTEVSLIDLLRGIIVQSGNDASVAVAEYFAGSEDAFADWMNQYAIKLGMTNSHFMNATGWPAEEHHSTARDIATLAWHIIKDHPAYYGLYSEKYFEYNDIRQPNRNKLLWRDDSVDGLKTGHTEAAGFCLAASAVRDDMRLIAVVMGTRSDDARARETQKLLAYGFRYFQTHKLYSANDVLEQRKVWLGQQDQIDLGVKDDLYLTVPRGTEGDLDVELNTDEYIKAPIAAGDVVGTLVVRKDGEVIEERPLIAISAVEESGLVGQLMGEIEMFFTRLLR